MREFAPQEDLSIFGDTIDGVPNPLVPHTHPYPTRYHGPIFNQPQSMQPYRERPYGVAPYSGVGADPTATAPMVPGVPMRTFPPMSPWWQAASAISAAACAYHGYKRNRSVGWALWWAMWGGLAPVITPVIAVAQGYAKPAGSK